MHDCHLAMIRSSGDGDAQGGQPVLLAERGELVEERLEDLPLGPGQRDAPAVDEVAELGVVAQLLAQLEVQERELGPLHALQDLVALRQALGLGRSLASSPAMNSGVNIGPSGA